MNIDKPEQTSVNGAGTTSKIDARMTRRFSECSADLKAMRDRHGAESPEGHGCSNLLELFDNYGKAADEVQKARIEENIRWQMRSLAGICAMPTQERG